MMTRVELEWKENTESDLAGYKIIWGTNIPTEKPKILMFRKGVNRLTLDIDLKRKKIYTFSVIAFDQAGNESESKVLRTWYKE